MTSSALSQHYLRTGIQIAKPQPLSRPGLATTSDAGSSSLSRPLPFRTPRTRAFSTSPIIQSRSKGRSTSYYETLNVPRNASRAEIKGAYFRLSKLYHPDLKHSREAQGDLGTPGSTAAQNEKDATEKFHAISEAYKVLDNDRARRSYDRSLTAPSFHHHEHSHLSHHHQYSSAGRKRGATYAWEFQAASQSRAAGSSSSGRHYDPSAETSTRTGRYENARGNFTFSGRDEKSSRASAREEEQRRANDAVNQESAIGRFVKFLGILFFISALGGFGRGGGGGGGGGG